MITLKDYPYWAAETLEHIKEQLAQICHTRKDDITQIKNLDNTFWQGRSVGKIPTSSADVVATDKVGDLSYDVDYIYILVETSPTTAEWRRASLGSW